MKVFPFFVLFIQNLFLSLYSNQITNIMQQEIKLIIEVITKGATIHIPHLDITTISLSEIDATIIKSEKQNIICDLVLEVTLSADAELSKSDLLKMVSKINLYDRVHRKIIPFMLIQLMEEAEIYNVEVDEQIDFRNKMEADGWIQTDGSTNQYRKDISETKFLFREDRIIDPVTKETEVYESEIDIDDYTWGEIISDCEAFGYTAKEVDKWLTEGEELALIAECIFELE
jgi:hypothetical protein